MGLLLYLAQRGEKANDAFLGIGIIGWGIIVVVVALAVYLLCGVGAEASSIA